MLHLDADDPESSRLQSLIWDPEVETWLTQLDIQPGWQCVDLGCGALGILEPLSRRAGPTGRIIGIEPRPALLETTREFIRRSKLENVRLLDTSPHRTTLPEESFQLVHARFLLAAGADEQELVEEMLRLTKPGGIVASQEPVLSSWRCYPDHEAWTRLRKAVRAAFATVGGDLEAGQRTFTLLKAAGLEDVRIRAASIALQGAHPSKNLLVDLARSRRDSILESRLMSEAELDGALTECERIARDPDTIVISFLVSQVWGRQGRGRWLR